jgi:uncharacterized protein
VSKSWDINPFGLFFFVVMFIDIMARMLSKTKSWWLGGVIGLIIGALVTVIFSLGIAGIILSAIFGVLGWVFDFIVSKRGPWKGGGPGGLWLGGMGGTGGRGGFGGGFGGFGGGGSGGGGASGRW